ncbi:MAG: undecaprenyl-phosphate glucose phosphotransferase [Bauldia sp.]|nr:undecaprenyl-phosphate glucose phosphotransferase [Bauldia sp.]
MNNLQSQGQFASRAVVATSAIAGDAATAKPMSDEARQIANELANRSISATLLTGWVRLFEFAALVVLALGIYAFHVVPVEGIDLWYAIPVVLGAVLATIFIQAADGYSVPSFRSHIRQIARIWVAWVLVFALFAVVAFLTKTGAYFSRGFFVAWLLTGLAFFALFRLGLASVVRRWTREGRLERRAVIVGGGPPAAELIEALEAQPDNDIRICGIFDDRDDARSPRSVAGYTKVGTVAELVEFGRIARIDMLIVSLPMTAENRLLQFLKQIWVLPVDVRLSAHSNRLRFRPRSYSYVGSVPFLDVFDKPIADWDSVVKRIFDIVCGAALLVLFSPLMLLTALAIKLDTRGPVFFRQKRYGFNNEVIDVLKFRSMHHDMADPAAKKAVTKGDPRVTRVGRFIRKASIDELPQLINVIRGSLSLVGPRPHAVGAHTDSRLWNDVVDGYFARHRVKPGVTGWAQINGWRGEVDTPEKIRGRVEADLYYIENWSVLFDLYILALTPIRLFTSENAY